MTSRFTRREVMAGGAGAVALATAAQRAAAQAAKPNIVYIMADDLGYADVSCYGRRDYTTANIDRLAQGGMRFMQAYAEFGRVLGDAHGADHRALPVPLSDRARRAARTRAMSACRPTCRPCPRS